MAIIDDQLARCKAAVIRLEDEMPEDATGETKLEIAVHEVHDLDAFLQNAEHAINVMRNMNDLRNAAEIKLSSAEAVLMRHPDAWAEYQHRVKNGPQRAVNEGF